jgi:sigma-B regulation protein RsbU (phosphoserine phosphatase)
VDTTEPRVAGVRVPPPSTILVVDDSTVNLQLLVRALDGSGHRILAATNGRMALEIARLARPDLMLLDIMMPELDGLEVCRAIKGDPDTCDIEIIFLSALGDESDIVEGLRLGAVDYIAKPIRAEEVLARVANHLSRQYLERELKQSRERLDHELANAGLMQQRILPPSLPSHPSIQFSAYYRTSRHAGGDYYDVLAIGPERFAVIVADVSGHGAPAAIVMAMIRAVLHTYPGTPEDPPTVLHYINRHFRYLWDTAMFATAVFAIVDAERRTVRLSSAGHPPPLLVRSGHVEALRVTNAIALLFDDLGDVPCVEQTLEPGDRVLFYTDGTTDRRAPDGSMYEVDRMIATLGRLGPLPPGALVDQLIAELNAFASGLEPDDDQTLLLVGVE